MSYQKNQTITVKIEDMGAEGEGIGKVEGYTLFVKDALIGDLVEAKIVKPKKSYAFAKLEKIIKPSKDRIEPPCLYHRQCGGCQIQALSYATQLKFKEEKVRNHLIRIGRFEDTLIHQVMESIIGMSEGFRYRNKAQFPVGVDKDGNLITGFYAGRTHSIISNTDCMLGASINKNILEEVLTYMKKYNITAYDEKNSSGVVRHILIREGFHTGEVMVCLVVNGDRLPETSDLITHLQQAIKGKWNLKSVLLNCNTEDTNVILGKKTEVLWGQSYITDYIKDISFQISAQSFYQVNSMQTEKLYSIAIDYAGLTGKEIVWDLYCGIGTITLCMAKQAAHVFGVEIVPKAIEDAKRNAQNNKITNTTFYEGKAEEVLPDFYEKERAAGRDPEVDVIVVDPPRKGCDVTLLDTISKIQPKRVVYVSCDSATLARDLRYLCDRGYEIKKVRPVDQFAQTVHVESIILMTYCGSEGKK